MMQVGELLQILDSQNADASTLAANFFSSDRAQANLDSICKSGMTSDLVSGLFDQFLTYGAEISDPGMALNNLEKFIRAARSPLALGALFERDPTALPILLKIFSSSQYLSDLLIRDTEAYDSLRLTEGQRYSRELLVNELVNETASATEPIQVMQILRRFKRREILRIAFGDLIVEQPLREVVEQISFLADAVIEAALSYCRSSLRKQWGAPIGKGSSVSRYVVFALGKLGGLELNYSSDIDLIAVYEFDGKTEIKGKSNSDFFQRVTREMIKLINEVTAMGSAYRVDMRLRPEGSRGPVCCSSRAFLQYYELQGRNWERQALIKARPVAGDIDFGEELLNDLVPWIYRPIINRFDIAEIKALKRKIEHRTLVSGEEKTNVKTGHGGIRDIEFVIQFLQLLNGGTLKLVRTANTLEAIERLANSDCLNRQEAVLLRQNYCWLRRLEHLLQIMFDLQTHTLPESESEITKIAMRMGYRDNSSATVFEQFQNDLHVFTDINHRILNHLLHNAFETRSESDADHGVANAVDLVLQVDIEQSAVEQILRQYGIADCENGRRLIENLSTESTRFLSDSRCRHFLAAVIVELLEKVSQTPNPDATLVSLSSVAEAIGGKGALWELFSFNPPSLEMFVRLCASSDYLSSIIRRNPGMVDELIDSLLMESLPSQQWLSENLDQWAAGTGEPALILHSFKNTHHLRIGVRDIVGRDSVVQTHRTLSDVAEVCLQKVCEFEFNRCAKKYSDQSSDQFVGKNAMVVLALGKLGGREPNYHSDLDVVFLYDSTPENHQWLNTTTQHFYSQLAVKITKTMTERGASGKLYDLDSRLRPTGRSGALAISLNAFNRYFESGEGQLWERLAICKARPVFGSEPLQRSAVKTVYQIVVDAAWEDSMLAEIRAMRMKMQENCRPENLKRGVGGTVDIEFIAQMFQLKYARHHPQVLVSGTVDALEQLMRAGVMESQLAKRLIDSYLFLRGVESRLRLMNTVDRHDVPSGLELEKLGYLLRLKPDRLLRQVEHYRAENRNDFNQIFGAA